MMQKRRVLLNAAAAALQTLAGGIVLFILYRYLLTSIGADNLGVWALVLATTSAAGLANLGIATSTIKFVSQAMARGDITHANRVIQTAAISVAGLLGIVLPAAFPLLQFLLEHLIEPATHIESGLLILPYALLSFWLNAVAGVFQSCIDGLHRIDLRSGIVLASMLVYLALVFWLVPVSGLEGLAQAQVAQAALLLTASWVALKRLAPALPPIPVRWSRATFREILGYSVNFQVISVAQLLMEPIAKGLMSRFAGVGVLAYFEMAQRMVFQLRALVAMAHQAVVPAISAMQEQSPEKLAGVYRQSFRALVFFVSLALPLFIVMTPFVAFVWIGAYNAWFIAFACLMFAGWFLNLLANPAYFANLGTGHLRWNVLGHLTMGGLNLAAGVVLGMRFGGLGVAAAFAASILIGSSLIPIAYHRRHAIRWRDLVSPADAILAAATIAGAVLASLVFYRIEDAWAPAPAFALCMLVFAACAVVPAWRHPMRNELVAWIRTLINRPTPPLSP